MTRRGSLQVVASSLALFMTAAGPGHAQGFEVVSLVSPNESMFGAFGTSVSAAGDVNQDGFADVIVGAPWERNLSGVGRAYLFSGQDHSVLFELISPNQEETGFFGWSVSNVGDVNQDGFADVIVGAPGESPGTSPSSAGRAYLFSGEDGRLLLELVSPNEEASGSFGWSVSGAGDVDLDGVPDILVGAPFEDPGASPSDAGRAYLFSSGNGGLLFELTSPNEEANGWFGWSVSDAGDAEQDGFPDVIVGAPREGTQFLHGGRAHVFSGRDGSPLASLLSPNEEMTGSFGTSVSGAGDVDKDGFADVVVGARDEALFGRAYVFSGRDGGLRFTLVSPNNPGGAFGCSVSDAGDVDQDGAGDVIVGACLESPDFPSGGRAHIYSGSDGTWLFELVSPNEESFGKFGYSVSSAGDVNQDGLPDLVVGAPGESLGHALRAGRAHIFLAENGQPQALRINSGGPDYTDADGSLFIADQAYAPGSYGYIGGRSRTYNRPIGGTLDDPLYQDLRIVRQGAFSYRFDVPSVATYDVTLYLMAPGLEGAGNVVMDVKAEAGVVFEDLDVTAQAGGEYQALTKTFSVEVTDGRLDLSFQAVNKAAVVGAIAVVQQPAARRTATANLAP